MTKFNKEFCEANLTYEGGQGYGKDATSEWLNMLFSSYMEDGFYEDADTQAKRFLELTEKVSKAHGLDFVAKAAVYSRNEFGIRSISTLLAAWLNDKQFPYKRRFYRSFPHRPDDVSEMFAATEALGQKLSHSMVRGTRDYISTLSSYSLGKYKMKGKPWSMMDIINVTHPASENVTKFKMGVDDVPDTWEVAISAAKTQEEKAVEWKRLVEERKLGYLALIRNLRNITSSITDASWMEEYLFPQLTSQEAIRKSLVYPYQVYAAYRFCNELSFELQAALSKAFIISCDNVPKFQGSTAVLLDVSGSMEARISNRSYITLKEAGAVYAMAIYLANPSVDFYKFGSRAKKFKIKDGLNVFAVIAAMCGNDECGYGTDIYTAFNELDSCYDRLFIISDEQTMDFNRGKWLIRDEDIISEASFAEYCEMHDANPHVFSFDLGHYHHGVFKPTDKRIHGLTALNDKIFKFVEAIEAGDDAIVSHIKQLSYSD